jgi:hypothetical protein
MTEPVKTFNQKGLYLHIRAKEIYYFKFLSEGYVDYIGISENVIGMSGNLKNFQQCVESCSYKKMHIDDLTKEERTFLFEKLLEN